MSGFFARQISGRAADYRNNLIFNIQPGIIIYSELRRDNACACEHHV